MKKLVLILLVAASSLARAQNNCPFVTVAGAESVQKGDKTTFTVNMSGGDTKVTPTYSWTTSDGRIISGQGTSTITLDTRGTTAPGTITATVDVGGFPKECITSNAYTIYLLVPEKKKVAKGNTSSGAVKK